jgi:SAM-dependent methyltransferase
VSSIEDTGSRLGKALGKAVSSLKQSTGKMLGRARGEAVARRYVGDQTRRAQAYLKAAREYPTKMSAEEIGWLHRKPYDHRPGHEQFYLQMYSVMNLLKAMDIPTGGRVLETGSGPGWVTEILMLLGHEVDGIEPCEALITTAKERIENARRHFRVEDAPRVDFHLTTFEECELPDDSFDAVIFHDALHHMIDEDKVLERSHRILRPGGVLGVSEDAWRPGDRQQESVLDEEMEQFGTLESPYTAEYLDDLLIRHGFVDIERYHSINGFFSVEVGGLTIEQAAQSKAVGSNNLTARKPSWLGPTTADPEALTKARIEILESSFVPADRKVSLKVRVTNSGESAWLHRTRKAGWVSMALRSEAFEAPNFTEAVPRHPLPETVVPGAALILDLAFFLPEGYRNHKWCLDLVNEGLFWFSQRATKAAQVTIR